MTTDKTKVTHEMARSIMDYARNVTGCAYYMRLYREHVKLALATDNPLDSWVFEETASDYLRMARWAAELAISAATYEATHAE